MASNEQELKNITVFFETVKTSFKRDFKKAVSYLIDDIVDRTPTYFEDHPHAGTTKANWRFSVGAVDSTFDESVQDFLGESTKQTLKTQLYTTAFPDNVNDVSVFISNSAPWIENLEYGGYPLTVKRGSPVPGSPGQYEKRSTNGYSNQAPLGIVGVAEIEWPGYVRRAILGQSS